MSKKSDRGEQRVRECWRTGVVCGLMLLAAGGLLAQPTVNGLFYGDGDDALYSAYATSQNGSVLYNYLDASTNTMYVALVVHHSVNDNVCSPKTNKAYTDSASPWPWSGHRDCKRASDSEFASFTLECAPGSPQAWAWQQATGCALTAGPPASNWVSDSRCGASSPAADWPPGVEATSSTSWVANVNTYQAAAPATRAWNLYTFGTSLANGWKTPYVTSAPNDVTQVPGYPTYSLTDGGGLFYEWEWSMVYEWSVDLGPGGANCGDEVIVFITGNSHHSPGKHGSENDPFDPPPGDPTFSDFGDLPDSYVTTAAVGGARHYIKVNAPYLGSTLLAESDGQPTTDASGDGSEEDGVTFNLGTHWTAGSTQTVDVVVSRAPAGGATLGAWFDWNNDGDFSDPGEFFSWSGLTSGTHTLSVTVGSSFDYLTDDLNSRFRLFSSGAAAPGGSLDAGDFAGTAADGEVEDYHQAPGSLPVTLAFFEARGAGIVSFRWMTSTETGNLGFNIYSVTESGLVKVNRELIPSHVVDSLDPQHYDFEGEVGSADTFMVEDVDTRGGSRFHGPFYLDQSQGSEVAKAKPVEWGAIRAAQAQRRDDRRGAAKRRSGPKPKGFPAARLAVSESGVYRVTHEDLLAAGVDLSGARARDIALTVAGVAVPIHVDSPHRLFGPGSVVEFVGESVDSLYTRENVYTLAVDRKRALRAAHVPYKQAVPASFYLEEERVETQRQYSFAAPSKDPWFDRRLLATTGPVSASIDFAIDGWVPGAAPVSLDVAAWGGTDFPTAPDHHLIVELNGHQLGEAWFDGAVEPDLSYQVADSLLVEGANALELELPHDTGALYDLVNYDHLVVRYPRSFVARNDSLAFRSAADAFSVSGFATSEVVAYRKVGARVDRLETVISGGPGGFSASVSGAGVPASYWLAGYSAIRVPEIRRAAEASGLDDEPADVLVVSHSDFIDGLDSWAAVRRSEGLSVKLVDVNTVYERYSHGVIDPDAIRDYVRDAYSEMGTRFLLLVGGDTYDYFDYLGLGSVSFIPSIYARTGSIVRFAPVDPLYGDVDGDLVPEVSVGRWPVRTASELEAVVAKTLRYSTVDVPLRAVLAADAEDVGTGYSFSAASDSLAGLLGAGWQTDEVYLDELPLSDARTALLGGINSGAALTSYFGHSGLTVWSFQGLFSTDDVSLLDNADEPTIVTQWGCWNTYHVLPSYETLGNRLLLEESAGAAAVLGAATLTEAASERRLGEKLFARLSRPGARLGESLVEAKQELAKSDPGRLDVLLGWTLLGDPTLEIAVE